jgi:hypothetical protein
MLTTTKTNGVAVASFVCSIVGWFTFGISGVVGVILGYRARSQIRHSGGAETGEGFAYAGIIVGYCMIAFWVLMLVAMGVSGSGS